MKKSSSIFLGLTFLLSLSMPILFSKNNNASVVKAADGDIVIDEITIDDFLPSLSDKSVTNTAIVGESGAEYNVYACRGNAVVGTIEDTEERYNSLKFTNSDKSHFIVTKTVGYIKQIDIFTTKTTMNISGNYHFFAGKMPYTKYSCPLPAQVIDNGQFEPQPIVANTSVENVFEKKYRAAGFVIGDISSAYTYVKSIKITWELHDFSDDVDWNVDEENGIDLDFVNKRTFQIEATKIGTGEETGGKIIYEIENPLVATVDENGLITATGGGYTTITITYGNTSLEADIWVIEDFKKPTITASITGESNSIYRIDSQSGLHAGDVVMIVCEDESKVMGSVETREETGVSVDATIVDHTLISFDSDKVCYFYVSGNATDGFIFTSNEGQAISYSDDYGLEANNSTCSWNVSINDGIADISNAADEYNSIYIYYDDGNFVGSDYGTAVSIYKVDITEEITFEITDRYGSYRSPALTFSHLFLNEMHALCEGKSNKQTLEAKWNELLSSTTFDAYELNDLSMMLFENANAVLEEDGGDTIQQAMALYDYLLSTYNFANDPFNRIPKSNSNRLVVANANEVMIVVSVLLISTLAAAFLFRYLKGKKINY